MLIVPDVYTQIGKIPKGRMMYLCLTRPTLSNITLAGSKMISGLGREDIQGILFRSGEVVVSRIKML